MIKCKNGDIWLDGSSEDLLVEATSIVVRVIQGLLEEDCIEANDVPKIINNLTQLITEYTLPNNNKYN
nr:MAG TPA: exosome complex exonuclease [Caudoviricetes sp.]